MPSTMPGTITSTRKRKAAEEAVESPPKRQTRARTAKTTQEDSTLKPKTTRITTASARIAAEARAAARSAPKFKAVATASARRDAKTTAKTTAQPPKTRAKVEKPSTEVGSKPTTRVSRSVKEADSLSNSKTRPRQAARKEPEVKRTVRTRSATIESANVMEAKPDSKKVIKRVTFQEDLIQEKENKPIAPGKESTKGIKAKPVRKILKTPIAPCGKKGAASDQPRHPPLSPKKVTQVAKSLTSSDDELARTPPRKGSKILDKASNGESTVSDLLNSSDKMQAPDSPALLASPAKRPPPSPFKDGLNQSPKKFAMPIAMPDLSQGISAESIKSPLKQSPIKFNFTPARPAESTTNVGALARAALLGTPARRPTSPLKLGSARIPEKIGFPRALTNTTSIVRHVKDASLFSVTPKRLFQSSAKAVAIPDSTEAETTVDSVTEAMVSTDDPTISEPHNPTPHGFQKYSAPVRFGGSEETFQHDVFEDSGHYRSLEDESEDELSMGTLTSSPQKQARLLTRLASTPSSTRFISPSKAPATPLSRAGNQFMTPLAVQLGNWLATSPTKPESGGDAIKGIFAPATTITPSNKVNRRTTMTPGIRMSSFEEQFPRVDVTATPEESLEDQDLHVEGDLDMTDAIVSDSVEEIISATPEQPLNASNQDLTIDDDTEILAGDLEAVAENVAFVASPTLQESSSDLYSNIHIDSADASEAVNQDIVMHDDASVLDNSGNLDADETVIISRSQTLGQEATTERGVEQELDHDDGLLLGSNDQDIVPASSTIIPQESQEYGDENLEPVLPSKTQASAIVSIDVNSLQTPVRRSARQQEIRTVARVPLKPSADGTPLQIKVRKGRSKSTGGQVSSALAEIPITSLDQPAQGQDFKTFPNTPVTPRSVTQPLKSVVPSGDELISLAETPFKSVRKGNDAQILRGAVVYVDVHTSEGADASGIFVELLTQMGARCVKQWHWNPRSTLDGEESSIANTKVGITHVVFKDGSKRVLQKVREAKGLVLCVGVGWVLDCERANRWLDEAAFAVDTSTIPRGGYNRRKSMEPTLLANLEGNLSTIRTPAKPARKSVRLSKARSSDVSDVAQADPDDTILPPFTPGYELSSVDVTTPSTRGANVMREQLVQQTCPPKQSQASLFDPSTDAKDQATEHVKFRLTKARRRTMQFVPRIASPLSQGFPERSDE